MTGLRRDPDDYALLDRMRRRRREPDPRTMRFIADVQEGMCRRQPAAFTLDPEQIRDVYPGLDEAEIAELARYFDTVRATIRPPTPYEGSHHIEIQVQAALIDEAVARLGRWPVPARPPLFALLESGHVNARTVVVPDTGDPVVFVDTELMQFLFLFGKAVALAVPQGPPGPNGMLSFATKPEQVAAHLRRDPEPLVRFFDVVLSYAMTGRVSSARPYSVPPAIINLSSIITQSAQTFVLAHEYAHVLERHLDQQHDEVSGYANGEVRQSVMSLALESIADRVGLDLTLEVMNKKGYDFTMTYWGVELFLYANEIALRAISLLRTGDERGLRQDESMLHAAANGRRTILPVVLHNEFVRGLGEEKGKAAWERLASGLHVVREIVDLLWDRVKPQLVAAHRRGARPSEVWEQG